MSREILPTPIRVNQGLGCDDEYDMVLELDPMVRLQEMLRGEERVYADEFYDVVGSIFGKKLVEGVRTTKLKGNGLKGLERRHCLEMLAGIGHGVTLEDLNQFYSKIRQMPADAPVRHFLQIDAPTLQACDRVENLPAEDFQKLIRMLRNPLPLLEPVNPRSLWEEIANLQETSDKKNMAYTRYEQSVQHLESADTTRAEFPFAPHELLAKAVAYAQPESIRVGMILPVFTNKKVVYYRLESNLREEGIHAYLFTPIEGNAEHPAQLVFRGTAGKKSLSRDLDSSGVGKSSFDRHAPEILAMVEAYAERVGANFNLELCGHSLGAADAQRATAMLVDQRTHIPNLKGLRLFAYCSPKLDQATVDHWKRNLVLLADEVQPPRIELNFVENVGDLVTRAGDYNLCSANAAFIEANYLLVKSTGNIFEQHQTPFFQKGAFDPQSGDRTFVLFQDREDREERQEMLERISKLEGVDTEEADWKLLVCTDEQIAQAKEAEERLAQLELEKAAINATQAGAARHSWSVWAISMLGQPVKWAVSHLIAVL